MDTGVNSANVSLYQLNKRQRFYLRFKRAADFVLALAGLVVLLVPFGMIALLQKIDEPKEPVFFSHDRIGRYGRVFRITKFRSMKSAVNRYLPTNDAPPDGECMTKFGRFLRDSSIDELPQLFQVITGEMSLIGPRPLIPQEGDIHRKRAECGVYQLRPGITGWAQVNGRDFVNNDEKISYDREYMENISFSMDLKILWRTVKSVIRRENIL